MNNSLRRSIMSQYSVNLAIIHIVLRPNVLLELYVPFQLLYKICLVMLVPTDHSDVILYPALLARLVIS